MTKRTVHQYLVNALTMMRVAAAVAMVPLAQAGYWWVILGLSIAAFATDWLDGKLARRLKIVSGFGKFIDPLADKAVTLTLVWIVAWYYDFDLLYIVPACILTAYDLSMLSVRLLNQRKSGHMTGASQLAKRKTGTQMIALWVLLLGIALCDDSSLGRVAQRIGLVTLFYATYLTLRSWYNYRKLFTNLWQK